MSTAYVPPPDEKAIQHEGTQGLAINNTGFNRFLTLLALKTTAKFYSRHDSSVRISRHKIVKSYPWTHITEAATLKFVPENTSIPVPKVYCSFVRKNRAHIVMERIQGEEIHSAWKSLSEESRQKYTIDSRAWFKNCEHSNLPRMWVFKAALAAPFATHVLRNLGRDLVRSSPSVSSAGGFGMTFNR